MTIAVAQRNNGDDSTFSTSWSPAIPNTGANAGDLYLIFVSPNDYSGTMSTTSTGWKLLGPWGNSTSGPIAAFMGEEGQVGSLTVNYTTGSNSAWVGFRLTGAWRGGGIALSVNANTSGSTTHQSPALTPTLGGVQYLWLAIDASSGSSFSPASAPSGFSNFQAGTSGGQSVTSAEKIAIQSNQPAVNWGAASISAAYTDLTVAVVGPTVIRHLPQLPQPVGRLTLY